MRILAVLLILLVSQSAEADKAVSRNFDGGNDEIDWGVVHNTTTGDRTVCGWFKMTDDASADALAGEKNNTGTNAGYLIYQNTADVTLFTVADGTDIQSSEATTDIDGIWSVVCGTWSSSDEVTRIYVNGSQEDTDTGAGAVDSLSTTVEFSVGEDGAEGNHAVMVAGWILTAPSVWTSVQINEIRWHPEGIFAASAVGTTGMIVPAWTGLSPEVDIANNFDGTVLNSAVSTDGPPIMIGALGASY